MEMAFYNQQNVVDCEELIAMGLETQRGHKRCFLGERTLDDKRRELGRHIFEEIRSHCEEER